MDEHRGKILISESTAGRLYVYWDEWKSNRFLHIRYWFYDTKQDLWCPGKKGIAIPESKLTDFLGGLRKLLGGADG